jgi:nicotinate-nucleotide pyrophosphorylase (carboxylating)
MNPDPNLNLLIDLALQEDMGSGDLTTEALFSSSSMGVASLIAREDLIVCGLDIANQVFKRLSSSCLLKPVCSEGLKAKKGQKLARLKGPLWALLTGERTALNFVRHMAGIATLTRQYVAAIRGTGCRLLDTRKTTPGFRRLEKAAVLAGGGNNHRMGLFDGVMIKDNHIKAAGSIAKAVRKTRNRIPPTVRIEVECSNLQQIRASIRAGADMIMLDNMSPQRMEKAIDLIDGRTLTEASGRLDLESVRAAAETGVDFVSVGALTHGAKAADIAMDLESA